MEYKCPVTGQLSEPAWELCVAVQVDLPMGLREKMSIALLLKRCATTD